MSARPALFMKYRKTWHTYYFIYHLLCDFIVENSSETNMGYLQTRVTYNTSGKVKHHMTLHISLKISKYLDHAKWTPNESSHWQ